LQRVKESNLSKKNIRLRLSVPSFQGPRQSAW
jgi:hypothetical protein